MHLPSAGMIRFRFDGFAFASQPVKAPRGSPKDRAKRGRCKGAALGPVPAWRQGGIGLGLVQALKPGHGPTI
jgi:hypothetical protein